MRLSKRGRQATTVNLGTTKNLKVAKLIVDSIFQNKALTHISHYFPHIDWEDYGAVTDVFNQMLKSWKKLHQ